MAITERPYVLHVRPPGGEPFPSDPRLPCAGPSSAPPELRLTFQVGPEIELLFAATDERSPRPLEEGAYFDLTTLDVSSDFRRRSSTSSRCRSR